MTIADVARKLGTSRQHVHQALVDRGWEPARDANGKSKWFFAEEDFDKIERSLANPRIRKISVKELEKKKEDLGEELWDLQDITAVTGFTKAWARKIAERLMDRKQVEGKTVFSAKEVRRIVKTIKNEIRVVEAAEALQLPYSSTRYMVTALGILRQGAIYKNVILADHLVILKEILKKTDEEGYYFDYPTCEVSPSRSTYLSASDYIKAGKWVEAEYKRRKNEV